MSPVRREANEKCPVFLISVIDVDLKIAPAHTAAIQLRFLLSRVCCIVQGDAMTVCNRQQTAVVRRCASIDDAIWTIAFEDGLVARW